MTRREGRISKRALDLAVGSVLALVAIPVILVLAVSVAVTLQSWPFFVQWRVGRDGRLFRFVKLRTLPRRAPRYASKYEIRGIAVPRFAAFLRRTHLDELPQLFLVPLGRLSLVGPRPEMPQLHAALDPDFAEARTSIRPGCTCLWQIGEGCGGLIGEGPEYDMFYLRNRSMRLDLWILRRSVLKMVGRGSLLALDAIPPKVIPVGVQELTPARQPAVNLVSAASDVG